MVEVVYLCHVGWVVGFGCGEGGDGCCGGGLRWGEVSCGCCVVSFVLSWW